jgi:hypothetical protein
MELHEEFDVVAVVRRLASFPMVGAPVEALEWVDRAADRVKRWAEALQADAIHERQMAIMFPPLPPDPDDPADDSPPDPAPGAAESTDDAGVDGGGDGEPADGEPSGDDAPDGDAPTGGGGSGSGPTDSGTLPSLGGPAPPISVPERERLARRAWVLTVLSAIASAFREGRVSTAHVDVLAALLHGLDDRVLQRMVSREADLLAAARTTSVEVFRRKVRNLIDRSLDDEGESRSRSQRLRSFLKHWIRGADNMHCGYFELDPVRGAELFAALEAEITALYAAGAAKGLTRQQVAAQALCNIQTRGEMDVADATLRTSIGKGDGEQSGAGTGCAAGGDAGDETDVDDQAAGGSERAGMLTRRPAASGSTSVAGIDRAVRRRGAGLLRRRRSAAWRSKLIVLIDARTLRGGQHEHTVCETWSGEPFPPALAREMLYEAQVTYGLTFDGKLVGMSSGQRLATFQQRKALRIMYRTCAFPGCEVDFDECEVHHVVHVKQYGGTTILETLVPLCRRRGGHHDLIHDGGWRAKIDGERALTWLTPSGDVHAVTSFTPLAELDQIAACGSPPPSPGVEPGAAATTSGTHHAGGRVDIRGTARPRGQGRSGGDGGEPPGTPPAPRVADARQRRVVSAPTLFDEPTGAAPPAA